MTDTATPGPLAPPPRRSGPGCLWGCLFAGLIAITALIGAFSYLGWYFTSGFKNDPTLAYVMTTVKNSITRMRWRWRVGGIGYSAVSGNRMARRSRLAR